MFSFPIIKLYQQFNFDYVKKTFDVNLLEDGLSELLSAIQNQVEVTLTRDGVPLAKVLPCASSQENVSANN